VTWHKHAPFAQRKSKRTIKDILLGHLFGEVGRELGTI